MYFRRKTPGASGNKRVLEVNLAESSRKFITCIRKYILFYLKLLEESGDISTLERAYISIRADKRVCVLKYFTKTKHFQSLNSKSFPFTETSCTGSSINAVLIMP